jgi:hypothetical protein
VRFGLVSCTRPTPPDGPFDLFQNTCLVREQVGRAGIQHYNNSQGDVRRSFNNIFVDVDPSPNRPAGYATAFLPSPTFAGPTDGNCYFQLGGDPHPLLRHNGYGPVDQPRHPDLYPDLQAYYSGAGTENPPSSHFEDSQTLYPPGFEKNSIDVDPCSGGSPPTEYPSLMTICGCEKIALPESKASSFQTQAWVLTTPWPLREGPTSDATSLTIPGFTLASTVADSSRSRRRTLDNPDFGWAGAGPLGGRMMEWLTTNETSRGFVTTPGVPGSLPSQS